VNKLKLTIISLFALAGALTFAPQVALAACGAGSSAADCLQQGVDDAGGSSQTNKASLPDRAVTITNVLLFILGAIAIIMIIIGGIRYVVSAGDSSAITGAKNTILYAVIGLVVAILAYAIVNFVIKSLSK
jgi:hypothetical protein